MPHQKRANTDDDNNNDANRIRFKSSRVLAAKEVSSLSLEDEIGSFSSSDDENDVFVYTGKSRLHPDERQALHAVDFEQDLEEIGEEAFRKCSALPAASIPHSVHTVGRAAFQHCENLVHLYFAKGRWTHNAGLRVIQSRAFENCSSLRKVEFPWTLEVIEAYAFFSCNSLEDVLFDEGLRGRSKLWRLREIGKDSFSHCSALTKIKFPSTVEWLGEYAFRECLSLAEVDIEEGLKTIATGAFFRCVSLQKIKIVGTVEAIGDYAFAECQSLSDLELSEGLKRIGNHSFSKCISLLHAPVPSTVEFIGDEAFPARPSDTIVYSGGDGPYHLCLAIRRALTTVSFANDLQEIGGDAFHDCTSLTRVTFHASIHTIGNSAFRGCDSLMDVTFAQGLRVIKGSAFEQCRSIRKINFPSTLQFIGANAFQSCDGIRDVEFQEGLQGIRMQGFAHCKSLAKIRIPSTMEYMGENTFRGCTNLEEIEIIGSVLSKLPNGVFFGCTALKEVKAGPGMKVIGDFVFEQCKALSQLSFSEGLKTIGRNAFSECSKLSQVRLPSTVESIGHSSFSQCRALLNVRLAMRLEEISSKMFIDSGLLRVEMGPNVRVVQAYSFFGCVSLIEVVFVNGLATIGDMAFAECVSMTHVKFPETLRDIGYQSFYHCQSIYEIQFPSSLEYIGQEAFVLCISVPSVDIPSSVKTVGVRAFQQCTNLAEANLQEGLRRIGAEAFAECGSLARVKVPSTVEILEKKTFCNDTSLADVDLQEGLKAIEAYVFAGCCSLTAVKIPTTVEVIRDGAFISCKWLISVEFVRRQVPRIDPSAFHKCRRLCNVYFSPHEMEGYWHTAYPSRQHTEPFVGCTLLNKRFGRKRILKGVISRFDKYPVHRQCYHASTTTADELRRTCQSYDFNCRDVLVDRFQMTPFHILLSSPSCTGDLLQVLLDAYPPTILACLDIREKSAMDYLNSKLWTSKVKILMHMCLLAFMVDRVGCWGGKEKLEVMTLKVSAILEQPDEAKRATLLQEAFENLRKYEIKGRVFQLELALWKSSMIACEVLADAAASERLQSRVVSGASVVIPSVIAFLQQPRSTTVRQSDAKEDSHSAVEVDDRSSSVSVVSVMESSETESYSEDDLSVVEVSSGDSESEDSIAAIEVCGGDSESEHSRRLLL